MTVILKCGPLRKSDITQELARKAYLWASPEMHQIKHPWGRAQQSVCTTFQVILTCANIEERLL